ncbi:MAG: DNA modification methylase [Candidatus Staskawiczbacteria bacterium]|nr:DNA modification methylase [Candidatus Staskawiczbacteria bacterium]
MATKQIKQTRLGFFSENTEDKILYSRTSKEELSFAGEKLIRGRHKIHSYPAMLHPLLVDYLINSYAKKEDVIFDPFCGSGVTLLQSSISGHKSIGFDINPLALLIAKTKTTDYDIEKLRKEFADFKKSIQENKNIDIPQINNIDYWYTKDVIKDLARVRNVLKNKKYNYQDFFIANFAFICRDQSLTRNGEFKRYRLNEYKIKKFENKVFDKLFKHIEEIINIIENSETPKEKSWPILANSENITPKTKYDLVITSPPYGDSRTTVAYGEYSSFGSDWIDDMNSYGGNNYKIDKESMGKVGLVNEEVRKHPILINTIKKIEDVNPKRAKEVFYFFNGYYKAIKNIVKGLNKNGRVCFVVGNRTVKEQQIPMDQITASFLGGMNLHFWLMSIL